MTFRAYSVAALQQALNSVLWIPVPHDAL